VTVCAWLAGASGVLLALIAWRTLAVRREAIARACHEVRGPLTAAGLAVELAARMGGIAPAQLRAIKLELEQAGTALDDLACAGARCRTRAAPETVDVEQLLADAVDAWHAAAAARGVRLQSPRLGAAARVRGDRVRLAQALGNLIANAIEHGARRVDISGRVERSALAIEVVDDGPGLPAPIAQLARRARAGRGRHGRGLAIASQIAKDHGGRLAGAPAKRGARVVLELPTLAKDAQAPDGTARALQSRAH